MRRLLEELQRERGEWGGGGGLFGERKWGKEREDREQRGEDR